MAHKTFEMDEEDYAYFQTIAARESSELKAIRDEMLTMARGNIAISPEQGQFLSFFIKAIGAKNILELGLYAGYSALWMAEALPSDGKLITIDINDAHLPLARKYWEAAGVTDRIQFRLGDAIDITKKYIEEKKEFDFIFVDADKGNYLEYLKLTLQLLSANGVAAFDNTLWFGRSVAKDDGSSMVATVRELNKFISQDDSLDFSVLTVGGGLTLLRKKS